MKKFILVMIACWFVTGSMGQTAEEYFKRAKEKDYSDNTGAIADYTKAISLNPRYAEAYYRRGIIKQELEDFKGAVEDLTRVIDMEPKNKKAYLYRASSKAGLKDYSGSFDDYSKAIAIDPDYILAYTERGDMRSDKMNDSKGGLEDYNKAVSIDPGRASTYAERAWFKQYKLHDYEGALTDYDKAIELDNTEDKPNDMISKAMAYNDMGKYTEAIYQCEHALKLDKDFTLAHIAVIFPLAHLQRFSEVATHYRAYTTSGQKNELNDSDYGFIKKYIEAICDGIVKNDHAKALADLQEAEKLFNSLTARNAPDKSGLNYILSLKGYVLEKLNRNAEARDTYNQALAINPNQLDVKQALAALEKKLKITAQSDVTPPTIELINPKPSRSFDIISEDNETQIIGKAIDASGIASVKINGFKVGKVEEDGLFIAEYTLKSGKNDLEIIATDKQGNTATQTFTITGNVQKKQNITDIPAFTNTEVRFYAILIAAEDYQDRSIPNLQNPVKDARELKAILESQYGFNAANIDTLYNRSREDIMQGIVQRCNTLTENDNLLIFYAGHGIAEKDRFGDVDGYWIPVSARKGLNATYISSDDINKALKRSNAKHIMLVADACFSGAFTRQLPPDASLGIQKQYALTSRKVMASGNLEPVPDNSKFIYYLKKNLRENKEKYLTAKKLFDGFYEAILNNSENTPQYAAIKNVGDEGGEFIFIKK